MLSHVLRLYEKDKKGVLLYSNIITHHHHDKCSRFLLILSADELFKWKLSQVNSWKRKTMEAKEPFLCAKSGDVDYFKTVAPEILLQARDKDDDTVLVVAAMEGYLDCCEVIVERCMPLLYHQEYTANWSVLHKVVAYSRINLENIMRFLMTADSKAELQDGVGGKIPNKRLLTMQDIGGGTALHLAVKRRKHEAIKLLLEADRDFELLRMADNEGQTCLHLAAWGGDHVSAELIIKARPGIDCNQRTTPHCAVNQLLIMPDFWKNTPLHLAVKNNNLEIVRLLIEGDMVIDYCANNTDQTPLLMAISKATEDGSSSVSEVICKLLLEKDPTQCTKQRGYMRRTPLHHAASNGLISVIKDIIRLCPDCINIVDIYGQNVLHIAACYGHPDVVQLLFETKETNVVAFLNIQDEDGNTPLHLAASNGHVQVVRLMLEAHPIFAHIANISQQTPYMMATGEILSDKYGECSKSDLERGGGVKKPNKKLLTMQNKYGDTALHSAVIKRNHEVIKLLLEADRDSELLPMVDNQGRTCLHFAAKYGDHVSAKLIIDARSDHEFLKMTATLWK